MKPLFLVLSLGFCASIFATVRTVSNTPTTIAQYSTVQAAVDASASGDTIYVHGSPTNYPAVSITNKRLVILGPGWSPLKNYLPFKATINSITYSGAGCDNSELQGIAVYQTVTITFNPPANLRFIRNQFMSSVSISGLSTSYSGYIFQNNWFDGGYISATPSSTYTNFLIQNNIFYNSSFSNGNIYGFTLSNNVIIDHNLFYGPAGGTISAFGGDCKNLTISNNIFVRRDAAAQNSLSTFNSNITFNAGVNNPWAVNGNTNAGGNIENQDPQMVNQVAVNSGTNNPLLDFTIAAGPANNSATDGKDMGLLYDPSGALHWINGRMSRIPYIYSMDITNPIAPAGGTLTVQVEARKSN